MCEVIAHGVCKADDHYFNFFDLYYCKLGGSSVYYVALTLPFLVILFLWMNYIRRQFLVKPILKLRRTLDIPDYVSEAFLVPLSFGMVPLLVRIQAAQKNLDFSFSLGASLGGLWTVLGFMIGICSMILRISKRVQVSSIILNMIFIMISILLQAYIGFSTKITPIKSSAFLITYVLYLIIFFFKSYRDRQGKFLILTNSCSRPLEAAFRCSENSWV